MQVCQQRRQLLVGESADKARHHSLPCQHILPHGFVRGRNSAGQSFAGEDAMQVWGYLLERQVVVFMAVGAANLVKVLPFSFLRCERRH